ncbi:hypothetical protein P22_1707 [Propionispora sp. 2/2-37]|uniref:YraN family protein n=1 Tax=Propionispora sp. 2/2-37 TaxID=1677858 RepID=UPI0006BB95DB|nr:YraN family protein [Propionispora sp. 2/2-37]CUH95633.1 hypothetical protein P22_1707 [Propionispora sp. 2/2-37]
MDHIGIGTAGETAAAEYLEHQGYSILQRQYRSKLGEIDIIAQKDGVFVFVEVKTRRSLIYGLPVEAVGYRKQQKIIHTALCYLKQIKQIEAPCRFDVMEVYVSGFNFRCNHICNAFGQ